MIVFELICTAEHRFEGWFASGEAFERQRANGLLACPVCASAQVRKLPAAKIRRPPSATAAEVPAAPAQGSQPPAQPIAANQPIASKQRIALAAFVAHVLEHTEDVGRRFPEEARKIHYEEAEARSIRGVASREEAEALADEGIAVFPLPIPAPGDVH